MLLHSRMVKVLKSNCVPTKIPLEMSQMKFVQQERTYLCLNATKDAEGDLGEGGGFTMEK